MDTGSKPAQLLDLRGLTLEQIAALPTVDEVLARILPDDPPVAPVPVTAFQSAI